MAPRGHRLMADTWFGVFVAAQGPDLPENAAPREGEAPVMTWPLDNLARAVQDLEGIEGPVAGWGGSEGGPNIQLSVRAEDVVTAVARAADAFARARDEAGIALDAVVRVEAVEEGLRDRLLNEPGGLDL
jgi:hypothetical protein